MAMDIKNRASLLHMAMSLSLLTILLTRATGSALVPFEDGPIGGEEKKFCC